jgi:CBS-domain-containing membrane protein
MTSKLITIHPEATMLEAYQLMFFKEIRHLPVFDEDKQLVGMLSDKDIQRAMVVDKTSPTTQVLSLSSEKKVSDFMNWPVHSVLEETPLTKGIEYFISKKISALMIVNKAGEFTGIITSEDLLFSYLNLLNSQEALNKTTVSSLL